MLKPSRQKNSIKNKAANTGKEINQIFHLRFSLSIYFSDLSTKGIATKIKIMKNIGQ